MGPGLPGRVGKVGPPVPRAELLLGASPSMLAALALGGRAGMPAGFLLPALELSPAALGLLAASLLTPLLSGPTMLDARLNQRPQWPQACAQTSRAGHVVSARQAWSSPTWHQRNHKRSIASLKQHRAGSSACTPRSSAESNPTDHDLSRKYAGPGSVGPESAYHWRIDLPQCALPCSRRKESCCLLLDS